MPEYNAKDLPVRLENIIGMIINRPRQWLMVFLAGKTQVAINIKLLGPVKIGDDDIVVNCEIVIKHSSGGNVSG